MATRGLSWDNTAVNASVNAIGQRASKRIKAVGGAWDTSGFLPANTMAKTVSEANATVTANRVYEFKIEALCTTGGPTINTNGIQEGIAFECIGSFEADGSSSEPPGELTVRVVDFDTLVPDINKVRFKLYNAAGTILVNTSPDLNSSANIEHTFTGLDPGETYSCRVEYGAIVNGVQVWSEFEPEICYYTDLIAGLSLGACRTYEIVGSSFVAGAGDYSYDACEGGTVDSSLGADEAHVICAQVGTVIVEQPDEMAVNNIAAGCNRFKVHNNYFAVIDGLSPVPYDTPVSGSMPLANTQKLFAPHSGGSGSLNIEISGTSMVPLPFYVKLYINNGLFSSVEINGDGTFLLGSPLYSATDFISIIASPTP